MRLAAILILLAAPLPALAQDAAEPRITVEGPCVSGLAWSGGPGVARIAACDAPASEPILRLRCEGGVVRADIALPAGAAVGTEAEAEVTVDGTRRTVSGTVKAAEQTGDPVLAGLRVPPRIAERLASGVNASLTAGGESRPFHLTGSFNAITAMRGGC